MRQYQLLEDVVSIEGLEGAGKTSVAKALENSGIIIGDRFRKVIYSREPGGVDVAEKIRDVIIYNEMQNRTEMFLYAAARAEHFDNKILPFTKNNKNGNILLIDRFIDSSFAIQGYARGLGLETVYDVNIVATQGYLPELTIYLDIDTETGLKRANKRTDTNKFEGYDKIFHDKVRNGFLDLHNRFRGRPYHILDTTGMELAQVVDKCTDIIRRHYMNKCTITL